MAEVEGFVEKFEEKPTKDGSRTYRVLKVKEISGLAFGGIAKGIKQGDYVKAEYEDDGKGIRFTKVWKVPSPVAEPAQQRLTEALEEKIAQEDFKTETMLRMNAVKTASSLVNDIENIEQRIDLFKSLRAEIYNWLKEVDS